MKVKYTSCDTVTEVEEEIIKVEFNECVYGGQEILFYRPDGDNFTVGFDRIEYIKG